MFNSSQILDQLLQTAQGMMANPTSSSQQKGGSGIGGIGDLLNNPMISGALSGIGGGLLSGLLSGNNKVSKTGGSLASIGGAAALGSLALTIYRNWMASKNQASGVQNFLQQPQGKQSQPAVSEFNNLSPAKQEDYSRAMLVAIIAAAKADGQIDQREQQIIHEQIAKTGDSEAAAWIRQEINKPLDVNQVAALATSPELATQIYLASLIVIDEQNELEKAYLDSLAGKLKLDPQLRREIERQVAA